MLVAILRIAILRIDAILRVAAILRGGVVSFEDIMEGVLCQVNPMTFVILHCEMRDWLEGIKANLFSKALVKSSHEVSPLGISERMSPDQFVNAATVVAKVHRNDQHVTST